MVNRKNGTENETSCQINIEPIMCYLSSFFYKPRLYRNQKQRHIARFVRVRYFVADNVLYACSRFFVSSLPTRANPGAL